MKSRSREIGCNNERARLEKSKPESRGFAISLDLAVRRPTGWWIENLVSGRHPWTMMTSSNGNISRVTGPLWGESTGHWWIPLTKASYVELWCFLWCTPSKLLSNQSRRRWFETLVRSLWRHCNEHCELLTQVDPLRNMAKPQQT